MNKYLFIKFALIWWLFYNYNYNNYFICKESAQSIELILFRANVDRIFVSYMYVQNNWYFFPMQELSLLSQWHNHIGGNIIINKLSSFMRIIITGWLVLQNEVKRLTEDNEVLKKTLGLEKEKLHALEAAVEDLHKKG